MDFKQNLMRNKFNGENFKPHHTLPFCKIHTSRSSFGFNQAASRMDPLRPAPVTVLQLLQLFNNKYLLLFKVKKSDNYNFPCCIRHICYE